jgi:rhodanese-related sulfurtransferase
MNARRFLLEALALIVAAVLCALVSNALAARERKLTLVGFYPNAQKVPAQATETAAVTATVVTPPAASATTAAPATTTIVVPTTITTTTTTTTTTRAPAPVPAPAPATTTHAPVATPTTSTQPKPAFTPHPDKPYIEIKYDDVKALHDGGALFLDARRTSIFEQGHIAGSRPFSVWESDIDDKVRKLFDERGEPAQQAQPIVVYCSGGDCEDSHMLAQKLWGIQFNNVYVYKDGYPDWVAHRGATRTGPTP